jgi:hypothetical protein
MLISSLLFYWADSGSSRVVSYQYTLNDGAGGSCGAASTAVNVTFTVKGPTGVNIASPTFGLLQPWPASQFLGGSTTPGLELGNSTTNTGITLTVTMTAPTGNTGSNNWIQILNTYNLAICDPTCSPSTSLLTDPPDLDNFSPYPNSGLDMTDNPGFALMSGDSQEAATFSATAYALWIPTAATGCSATHGACTIQVPLGSVTWGFGACAINAGYDEDGNGTTWVMNSCSGTTAAPFQPGGTVSSYPKWNQNFTNSGG